MEVIRFFVPGSSDNYNHLLVCEQTREAAIVDPFNASIVLDIASSHNIILKKILITHEHADHTCGVAELVQKLHLPVLGHKNIDVVDVNVNEGTQIDIGNESVDVLETPGHTAKHICFLGQNNSDTGSFIICADTLFNAGVGNTYSGDTDELFHTIKRLQSLLEPGSKIYPAHDYMLNNLAFSLSLEPENNICKTLVSSNQSLSPDDRWVTTWGDELNISPFLRLDNAEIRQSIQLKTGMKTNSDIEVFRQLRKLRNSW